MSVHKTRSYSEPKPFVDTWLGRVVAAATIVGTAATILGSVIGAWWAYSRYIAEDAPALELRPKLQGGVTWYRRARSDDECIAEFKITVENIGKSPIELAEATAGVWPLDNLPNKEIAYVDPVTLTKDIGHLDKANIIAPADRTEEQGAYLRTYYPPGVADELGMMFLMKRNPGKLVLFKAEGRYRIRGEEPTAPWFWHAWDEVCGLEELSRNAKDRSPREEPTSGPVSTPRPTE